MVAIAECCNYIMVVAIDIAAIAAKYLFKDFYIDI